MADVADTAHDASNVVIVGGGLAGLCCAIELDRVGIPWTLIEASDAVGGRLRTDHVDGFTLDRGFQVLLTAYPECQRLLDYDALDLHYFEPGALLHRDGRFHLVSDPLRRPTQLLGTATAPIGGVRDKARVALLAMRLRNRPSYRLMEGPDQPTSRYLMERGFSTDFIDAFLRPLFAGIQLDDSLATSSRAFEFVFGMLARGGQAVPARGIQAIPDQLAQRLDQERIWLGRRVERLAHDHVVLSNGERLDATAVVIATDGPTAARLDTNVSDPGSKPVGCVYFAADAPPVDERLIVLEANNAEPGNIAGPVNNLAVMSQVSESYAPPGAALIAAAVLPRDDPDTNSPADEELVPAVRRQLSGWFGAQVDGWQHLRTDRIAHAQPQQPAGRLSPPQRQVRLAEGLYVCGDHRDDASINGAMVSGRRAAEALSADR